MEENFDARKEFYTAARAELVARIAARDTALIAYIATIGGYIGFAIYQHQNSYSFLKDMMIIAAIPMICVTYSLIILQHHLMIGLLSKFIREEWPKNYGKLSREFYRWETSTALDLQRSVIHSYRHWSQAIILCMPMFYSVFYTIESINEGHIFRYHYPVIIIVNFFEILIAVFIFHLHVAVKNARLDRFKT